MRIITIMFLLIASVSFAAEVTIDPDRMLRINDQRTFVVGLYENPQDDAVLQDAVEAGINLIYAKPNQVSLDRIQDVGAYAWLNTGYSLDLSADTEKRKAALSQLLADYDGHPALAVWEVPDEALWNCWYQPWLWHMERQPGEVRERVEALEDPAQKAQVLKLLQEMQTAYGFTDFEKGDALSQEVWKVLAQESPQPNLKVADSAQRAHTMAQGFMDGRDYLKENGLKHPIWMNHAPRNTIPQLAEFNQAADMVGCDIYPIVKGFNGHSDLVNTRRSSVGDYTLRMQAAAPDKPVWMVLQAFGWADLDKDATEEDIIQKRRPTYNEMRFMTWDAIVNGARGVLYWGSAYIEKDSHTWKELLSVVSELKALNPILAAPDAGPFTITHAQTWGSIDRTVKVLGKEHDDTLTIIAVNEYQGGLTYTIHGLKKWEGGTLHHTPTDQHDPIKNGTATLRINGYGVQVLNVGE